MALQILTLQANSEARWRLTPQRDKTDIQTLAGPTIVEGCMASRRDLDSFDVPASRTVGTFTVAICIIALALFAGVAWHPKNTLALVDPFIRWVRPSASFGDIDRAHLMARELGHFLIPAVGFALLVVGPLRRSPLLALLVCGYSP
jgi:hypothetical protein